MILPQPHNESTVKSHLTILFALLISASPSYSYDKLPNGGTYAKNLPSNMEEFKWPDPSSLNETQRLAYEALLRHSWNEQLIKDWTGGNWSRKDAMLWHELRRASRLACEIEAASERCQTLTRFSSEMLLTKNPGK